MTQLSSPDRSSLSPAELAEGTVLAERFRIGPRLSEGAMSAVYSAQDQRLDRSVALKVFDPLRSSDELSRARFEREFQSLRRVNHPGVARVLDFVRTDELDLLVLELIEGETLKARLQRGATEIAEALGIVHRLIDAVEVCHRSGVIHRDLKPSNVIVHPVRGPVIVDFGSAWFSSALTLTRTGAVIGSPRYMAPELLQRGHADARADVYGMAAILYEMLAGRPARADATLAELAVDERRLWPETLLGVRPDVPRQLDEVLLRCLSPRPEDRPATAAEMKTALTDGVRALGAAIDDGLTCAVCGVGLVVSLPICPGCGETTDWVLRPGAYAVQILRVDRPPAVVAWLRHRHPAALTLPRALLLRRLANPPVPLVVGADRATADALAAQARSAGCEVEVVRAARRESLALSTPAARPGEIFAAAGLHLGVVASVGAALIFAGAPVWAWAGLPAAVGGAGIWAATRYARRPLLSVDRAVAARPEHRSLSEIAGQLRRLKTDRARRLASAAVARAAPLLLGDIEGLPPRDQQAALSALSEALEASLDLDAHRQVLKASTDERAIAERADVAAAHDLAVRRVLDACEQVSRRLTVRTMVSVERSQ